MRVALSRQLVYPGITKRILRFPNSFHIPCIELPAMYFHTVLQCAPFFIGCTMFCLSSDSSLFSLRSTIAQLNLPDATAEYEEYLMEHNTQKFSKPLLF